MNKFITLLITSFFLTIFNFQASASHYAGAEITYECLGNNQYEITLKIYRDCRGISIPAGSTSTQGIDIVSSCGANMNIRLPFSDSSEVSQLCVPIRPNSACILGNVPNAEPGMEEYVFRGTVTLPTQCNFYTISWDGNARNAAIVNLNNPQNILYVEAKINTQAVACNNSPEFTAKPIPYVCVNQNVTYNYGVVETDGDSLAFSLVTARSAVNTNYTYPAPFSGTNPINGITVNPNTGQISFTPVAVGSYTVVLLVDEYRNGVWIGSVMRDVQFVVRNCMGNTVPNTTNVSNTLSNGNAVINGNNVEMCEGNSACFSLMFSDPDIADTLNITSNLQSFFPNATFTTTGTNPVTVNICLTMDPSNNPVSNISIKVEDDACPIPATSYYDLVITKISNTFASPADTICLGDTSRVSAIGGTIFNWRVISGDPIVVGTNMECNPCASAWVTPSMTTTYEVTSDLTGACQNMDTVTIYVAPDIPYSLTATPQTILLNQTSILDFNSTVVNTYTYSWESSYLDNNNIKSPIFTPPAPGTYRTYIKVNNVEGCYKYDSIDVIVDPCIKPSITAVTDMATVFCSDSATLSLDIDTSQSRVTLRESFDLDYIPYIWNNVSGADVNIKCGSVSSEALHFETQTGTREAETNDLGNITNVSFSIFLSTSAGGDCSIVWGDPINFEYSDDGGVTWNNLATFTQAMWAITPGWRNFSYPINSTSSDIRVRWIQPTYTVIGNGNYDNWAIDDISIDVDLITSYNYQWTSSASIMTYNTPSIKVQPSSLTTYQAIVSTNSCADTSSVDVDYQSDLPALTFTSDTKGGCNPTTVTFTNTTSPSSTLSDCIWDFGDGTIVNNCGTVTHEYDQSGVYTVSLSVVTIAGCEDTLTIDSMVSIHDYAIADFDMSLTETTIPNTSISFTNLSQMADRYNWNFGVNDPNFTNNTSTDINPVIEYPSTSAGEYSITLIANNEHNCPDTAYGQLIINGLYAVYIPNSFTPDGDDLNDKFVVRGENISESGFVMRIFNRWGQIVYEGRNKDDGWDGMMPSGDAANTDVYVYKINLLDKTTGQEYEYFGHIQLIK